MTSSDSMFLFQLIVENFKTYKGCRTAFLKADFKDVFKMTLNSQTKIKSSKVSKTKSTKTKTKIRSNKSRVFKEKVSVTKIPIGQSLSITMAPQKLLNSMYNHDLELSLWNENLDTKLGSVKIPWSQTFIKYLLDLETTQNILPVSNQSSHNIYDELTYKKIAMVKLSTKLTYFGDKFHEKVPITFVSNTMLKPLLNINNIVKYHDTNYGVIKTTYKDDRTLKKTRRNKVPNLKYTSLAMNPFQKENIPKNKIKTLEENISEGNKSSVKIDDWENKIQLLKSKSYSLIEKQYKPGNYIFGDPDSPYGNRIYCVNYCTVERDPSNETSKSSIKDSEKSSHSKAKFKFKPCDSECQIMKNRTGSCPASSCTLDLPEEAAPLISIAKCKQVLCDNKEHRVLPPPEDDRILLDLSSLKRNCCDRTEITETIDEVIGGLTAKMKISEDPCFCSCECTFGFIKKTTFCKVCGGFEMIGDEPSGKQIQEIFPCPYYHKLIDKNKMKTLSTSGSDSKKKGDDVSVKTMKVSSSQKAATSEKRAPISTPGSEKKSVESEKNSKKSKKKDDRFKFNYGYKGIPPQIGHSKCALPCTGTLNNVPKKMGWLWTAEDVPGIKFRPAWKPGATNKHVVRLLRMARNPGEVLLPKKKRREATKKKPLIRPLLIVHKKDGEFTVTMETMKTFNKPRAINQNPYEDKPVLTYTIGRTEEENRERRKKKEREQRRLERAQRQFIQSAFRDMCREICLKTYQQALGILPDAEDPECTCYPALPTADRTNLDLSCSCSEEKSSVGSDTDSDEWIVEFTPPCATFIPTFKSKKVIKVDNSTQYTYLDYRVKLVDRFGNPIPRFFKGPDGKQQCSDLGGFWGPDKKWLIINVDGYIAPDGRWAPNYFIGPSGENVEAVTGKFQAANNKWLIVGVDGYVDSQGRWKFYPKPRGVPSQRKRQVLKTKGAGDRKDKEDMAAFKSEASWSCLGGASAKELSQLGIVGHGHDKKLLLSTLKDMLAHGENVKIPQPSTIFRLPPSKKRQRMQTTGKRFRSYYEERVKCKHSPPSDKGVIAVDDQGNKTYFRLKDYKNLRPKERLANLADRGISLSSFHVPCFHSFISSELMKKQQMKRLMALSAKSVATQMF